MAANSPSLVFSAGPAALAEIRAHGFDPARIGTLAGASGGAKWLVLSQLDRAILRSIVPKLEGPVHTIGTSIGAWRFGCYAQADPLAAIDRFEEAYLSQTYSEKPNRAEITAKSREILDHVFGATGVSEVLSNPTLCMHVMTVRCRGLARSEQGGVLAAGLFAAATANAVSRRSLGRFFERVLFYDERVPPPFMALEGFPMHRVPMRADNLKDTILATGSIPLVLEGVPDIAGAPKGMYRDGGVIDYHLDFPHSSEDKLALYPHFYDFLKPGWFDKHLSWRRPDRRHYENVVLLTPSAKFVERLPHGKIPDRNDFRKFDYESRVSYWREVLKESNRLADDFAKLVNDGAGIDTMKPFPV